MNFNLREGNHCADYIAKLGVSFDVELLCHDVPSAGLVNLLSSDVADTLFLRE